MLIRHDRSRTRQLWPGTRATMHPLQYDRSFSMRVLVRLPMEMAKRTYRRLHSSLPSLASTAARSMSRAIRRRAMPLASLLVILFLTICRPCRQGRREDGHQIGFARAEERPRAGPINGPPIVGTSAAGRSYIVNLAVMPPLLRCEVLNPTAEVPLPAPHR